MNLIYFILAVYFVFNIFFAGWLWHENWEWADNERERLKAIRDLLLAIPFAGLIWIGVFIWIGLKSVNELFQIAFYFRFYCTDYYDKVEEDAMKAVNKSIKKYNTSDSLQDRIMRHAIGLLNKRHNYSLPEDIKS